MDDASGLQTSGLPTATFGNGFILNPLRQRDFYCRFRLRCAPYHQHEWHLAVANRERPMVDAKCKQSGKRHTRWLATCWNLSLEFRFAVTEFLRRCPLGHKLERAERRRSEPGPSRPAPIVAAVDAPKLFGCDPDGAYQSFRNAFPGESGDRNVFRLPGYVSLDLGLSKSFHVPFGENQRFQIRWEVFNVTNTQHFGKMDISRTGTGVTLDPSTATPPSNWSNFTGIQGTPRVMQFGFRYSF